jgi:NAD(P)-dependent dehydrogenase (short-subunit alcohol dehydrogenase family)
VAYGPTVILTGASRGIGAAAATWLGRAGANLVLVGRDAARLGAVSTGAREHGGQCVTVAADLAKGGAAAAIVGDAVATFGGIDTVVNNAGVIDPIGPILNADLEAWRSCFEVNLFAPMALTREALPYLRAARGRVVNTSTALAHRPVEALGAYCASKAALLQATRVLATEEPDIIACAFSPGAVDTAMMDHLREDTIGLMPRERINAFRRLHSQDQLVDPVDAGRLLAWLALNATDQHLGRMVSHDDDDVVAAATNFLS